MATKSSFLDGTNATHDFLVTTFAWGLPTLVVGVPTFIFMGWAPALSVEMVLAGILFFWELYIVPQQEWVVVERFSVFHSIKLKGWNFLRWQGMIDQIKARGDFKSFRVNLFE